MADDNTSPISLTVTAEGALINVVVSPYAALTTVLSADMIIDMYRQLTQRRREAEGVNIQVVRSMKDVIK